jgi:AMP deaminase
VFSVLQSGFEQQFKVHFLGNNYWKRSLQGNDIRQTNLPDVRIQFRAELLGDELRTLHHHTKLVFDDSLIDRIM